VPPGAGYTGLENQLYRIEIHDGGSAMDAATKGSAAARVPNKNNQIKAGGTWKVGQPVEVFAPKAPDDPLNGTLAYVTQVKGTGKSQTLILDVDVSKIPFDELNVREAKATFKWSRDNGVVVTTIQEINVADKKELTVHDLGPDDTLGFKVGNWVEISDDGLELNGLPGQLAQITKVDSAVNLITLNVPATLTLNPARHPKLRRWDGVGAVKFASGDASLDLESGVQVRFFAGSFKTADYWTIAARTATADTQSGNIEWPRDAANQPVALLPFGIKHHYCRLAMVHWDGAKFDSIEDCRKLFPPLTELTSLLYVNGAGQESMPGHPQPQALQAGVFNGRWPVAGARVRFTPSHKGRLAADIASLPAAMPASTPADPVTVSTGTDGLASCAWMLDPTVESQWVEARVLDAGGNPLPAIVKFDGNLSLAKQVFYNPEKCDELKKENVTNVQDAIDHLCRVHRGCCDVTVGKGGDFERLDEAIKSLRGRDQIHICICLLPGDHMLPQGLVIADPPEKHLTHVKIAGCGLATRLLVGDSQFTGKSFIKVGPLASFTLRDVAVATRDNTRLLHFNSCLEVMIENCHLSAYVGQLFGPPSVLTIERANLVRITGNEVSALFQGSESLPIRRAEFFQTSSLASLADDIGNGLGISTPAVRQQFVKPYQDFLKTNQRVSAAQRLSMDQSIRTVLEFNQRPSAQLVVDPVAIRALYHGTALALMDAQADTLIENNRFVGRVTLYGDEEWFGDDEWKNYLRDLKARRFPLTSPAAALQIRSNLLTGIRVDQRVLKLLQDINGQVHNLFGRVLLSENWCFSETYQLLANQLTIGSNQFNYGPELKSNALTGNLLVPNAAVVGGRSVLMVANSAPNPSSQLLFAVPPATVTSIGGAQGAANFLDLKAL
jgi:hypothetical protein